MRVGDETLSFDTALSMVCSYASQHAATVLHYDFGGVLEGDVVPSDGVTFDDLGRMTVINADLGGNDAAALLTVGGTIAWNSVAPRARLEDADPEEPDGVYAAMLAMWSVVAAPKGVGLAKASKLLHIKRPFAFPILDRDVRATYWERTAKSKKYWPELRRDLIDGAADLDRLSTAMGSADDQNVRRVARLPALRLLDIIAWSIQQR